MPLAANDPIKADKWANDNFWLSAESSGTAGSWSTRPYQKAILNAMSNDAIRVLTFKKSSRVAYTKLIVIDTAYKIAVKKRNLLIYQPTDSDATDFVKDEIDTMIRDVPLVGELLKSDPDKRSAKNTLNRKEFVGCVLDIKGGGTPRNYRRISKDNVTYDELDGFSHSITSNNDKGGGSPTELGDARMRQSSFPKSIRGSNPSMRGNSLIDNSYDEADLRYERYLPCPHCNEYHTLKWRNFKWDKGDYKSTHIVCEDCGGIYYYSDYEDMDEKGQWRSSCGTWIDEDDMFHSPSGDVIDEPFHIGFFVWSAYSYDYSWSQTVKDFIIAHARFKKTGDNGGLKAFWNTALGESYDDSESTNGLEWARIKARAEPYDMYMVPVGGLFLTAGFDTQDSSLPYVIDAWGRNQERWTIASGEIHGDPAYDDVWSQVTDILSRDYPHPSGVMMKISCAAIDSAGHRTQPVYNYCRGKHNIIAIIGRSGAGRPVIGRPSLQDIDYAGRRIKSGIKLWTVGTDTTKPMIMARLALEDHGGGYHHFPIGLDDDFYQQITAERLVAKYKNGVKTEEWTKIRRKNDKFDCLNYSYAAAIKAGMERINWDELELSIIGGGEENKTKGWFDGY